jgi:hypothetical protein
MMPRPAEAGRIVILGGDARRVPHNLPDVAIRIPEISGITAIEGVVRGLDDFRARPGGFSHDVIDLLAARDVVPDRE